MSFEYCRVPHLIDVIDINGVSVNYSSRLSTFLDTNKQFLGPTDPLTPAQLFGGQINYRGADTSITLPSGVVMMAYLNSLNVYPRVNDAFVLYMVSVADSGQQIEFTDNSVSNFEVVVDITPKTSNFVVTVRRDPDNGGNPKFVLYY